MNFPARLKSRKLWVTVATVAPLIAIGQYDLAANIIIAYLAAQGITDAAASASPILKALFEFLKMARK